MILLLLFQYGWAECKRIFEISKNQLGRMMLLYRLKGIGGGKSRKLLIVVTIDNGIKAGEKQ